VWSFDNPEFGVTRANRKGSDWFCAAAAAAPSIPMQRFQRALDADASSATAVDAKSAEELETNIYAKFTLSDWYEAKVFTRIISAFELGQTRVLIWGAIRVDSPKAYWEKSFEDVGVLAKYRSSFLEYRRVNKAYRISLDELLDDMTENPDTESIHLLSALVYYLQEIQYSVVLTKQEVFAKRDPTLLDPDSTAARFASFLGMNVEYRLFEYTLMTDVVLTRYTNQQYYTQANAARLITTLKTPRDTDISYPRSTAVTSGQTRVGTLSHSGSGVLRPPTKSEPSEKELDAASSTSSSSSSSSSDDVVLSSHSNPTTTIGDVTPKHERRHSDSSVSDKSFIRVLKSVSSSSAKARDQ